MNRIKLVGIIATVAIIALSMTGCSNDSNGGGGGGTVGGSFFGSELRLSGQVSGFTGNRTVSSRLGGSGSITNGQLSFTISTPSALESIGSLFDWLHDYYDNVSFSYAGARVGEIQGLTTSGSGNSGQLDRQHATIDALYIVTYIFTDRDVTVTGGGRTRTEDCCCGPIRITTTNLNLRLRTGWNAVHDRQSFGFIGGVETVGYSMGLGDIPSALWYLREWESFQAHSEAADPAERTPLGRSGRLSPRARW